MARIFWAPWTSVATARSTSAAVALGTVSTTEPSYGFVTSIFSGRSTHSPAQNIFMAVPGSRPRSVPEHLLSAYQPVSQPRMGAPNAAGFPDALRVADSHGGNR